MGLAFAFISLVFAMKQSHEQKKTAKEQAKLQKKQAAAEARMKFVAQQRAARKKAAETQASALASGAESSLVEAGILASGTATAENQRMIGEEFTLQSQQIDLSKRQTIDQANAEIGQAIGNFGASTMTPTGGDSMNMWERAFS